MTTNRDFIPAAIKRKVRQRCGFGCVMCGSPIFDYEHIDGYGKTGHDADQMTLLCPMHHREKTAERLPVSRVRKANKSPYNKTRDLGSKHPLYFDGSSLTVELGSLKVVWSADAPEASAIEVDGEPIIKVAFVDGAISLNLLIRDADNKPLLVVRDGELRHAVATWDVAFEGRTLIVRRALGDVVLRIRLMPPNRIVIERAEIWCRGVLIRLGKACDQGDGIEVANNRTTYRDETVYGNRLLLAVGDYLGFEGQIFTTFIPQRWLGGIPAKPGSFSRIGGGQRMSNKSGGYLDDCRALTSNSFLAPAVWGLPDKRGRREES
ncbi:HNH endonuclease signature motif containing protein [Pseudarthrobacter sp. C4D7]|uniref:HNH endonuclease signature motif containing protein n=1 Tax=Pseudarthrobacter sp. C4D7 TaxID=2735268 RepID=UPI001584CBA6|nr:HNH endonuclease signature motif containing protein [Pseudarthrobacter sp. C4D7]NUT72349.1 HNH endonuclease [Pseudarthrobacter sp. C4D7]